MNRPLGTPSPTVRVLLAEDSPSDATLCSAWLHGKPTLYAFDVVVSKSMEETDRRLHEEPFDVILLDLGLGDSTGLTTLTYLMREHTEVPIVVLTGLNDEQLAFQALGEGAQDFLVKGDFDEKLLRRSIRYAIERHRLERARKSLNRQLITVLGDEQQRIARELHDEVGQGLSGLNMIARALARRLRQQGLVEANNAQLISEGIQETLDSFRRVLCGLSPVDVDEHGLFVALQRLCDAIRSHSDEMECRFEGQEGVTVLDNVVATNLYRIAQESLTNARKHARPTQLAVRLYQRDKVITLQVVDDGVGFAPQDCQERGMGLRILRHRAELIGGVLSIASGNAGTTVQCEVQVSHARPP